MSTKRRVLLPIALLAFALLVRLPGIDWGLPDGTHHFSFHPDEYNVLRVLAAIADEPARLHPGYFHNPALYYYLCGAAYVVAHQFGAMPQLSSSAFHQRPDDVAKFYLLGRLLSTIAGALTTFLVAHIAIRQCGDVAGVVAGLLTALAPGHVVCSRYMDVDATLALLAAATLLAADLAWVRPRFLLLGAVIAGLATATKYNGLLTLLPLLVVVALRQETTTRRCIRAAGLALVALFTFTLLNPHSLLDWPAFTEGIRYVAQERVTGRWSDLGHGPLFPLRRTWPWLLGGAGVALAVAGAATALIGRVRRAWPAVALALGVYISVAASGTDYVRYSLAAVPALAVLAALPLGHLHSGIGRRAFAIAVVVATVEAAVRTTSLTGLMVAPDVRVQASRWIESELDQGSTILVPTEPYFFSPPRVFMDYFYQGRSEAWRSPASRYTVDSAALDPGRLYGDEPSVLVVSEHELLYPALEDSATGRFFAAVSRSSYQEVTRFDKPAVFGPLRLEEDLPTADWIYDSKAAASLRDNRLPHDLKYLNPAVLILARPSTSRGSRSDQ